MPDNPAVVDPYAPSTLRSASRPSSPPVSSGGVRGAPLQTAASSARWAAAALRGSPQGRGLLGGANSTMQGGGSHMFLMHLLWPCTLSASCWICIGFVGPSECLLPAYDMVYSRISTCLQAYQLSQLQQLRWLPQQLLCCLPCQRLSQVVLQLAAICLVHAKMQAGCCCSLGANNTRLMSQTI